MAVLQGRVLIVTGEEVETRMVDEAIRRVELTFFKVIGTIRNGVTKMKVFCQPGDEQKLQEVFTRLTPPAVS